jgi:tRNA(Ile)-lysidine synthase
LHADSGKYIVSDTHRILRNRAWLIISPLQEKNIENVLIEENQTTVLFQQGILQVNNFPATGYKLPMSADIAGLDSSSIKYPLLLRKWKKGDYFYPLGMQKKKKLARFFIDQKLSLNEKENVWVIEMNKKIIWVVGRRIDDRFKVNPQTKNILQLSIQ